MTMGKTPPGGLINDAGTVALHYEAVGCSCRGWNVPVTFGDNAIGRDLDFHLEVGSWAGFISLPFNHLPMIRRA